MLPLLSRLAKKQTGPMRRVSFTDVLWSIGFFILLFGMVYLIHTYSVN